MAKYSVRYVHKISTNCRCGRPRFEHRDLHLRDGSKWGHGPAMIGDCMAYEPGDTQDADLPSSVVELGDLKAVARMLREARLLSALLALALADVDPDAVRDQCGDAERLESQPWADFSALQPSDAPDGNPQLHELRRESRPVTIPQARLTARRYADCDPESDDAADVRDWDDDDDEPDHC
jgi:hypothetical protein